MRSPLMKGFTVFWPSAPVTAWTVPLSKVPTKSVPLSPHAICRAWGRPLAQTAIVKPGGSLILARFFSSSAAGEGVGWPGLGAWRMVKKLSRRSESHSYEVAPHTYPQYRGENDVRSHMRVPNRHLPYSKAECSQPCGNLKDSGRGGQNGNDEK